MSKLLLGFIYNVVEKGRRRALYEMLLTATDKPNDSNIRQRILRYLEETEHSKVIDTLLKDSDSGLARMMKLLENIWSPNEAAEVRGQVSRYLESYPDHPSLLMLRALAEIHTRDSDQEVVKQNFLASVKSSVENYVIGETGLYLFFAWSIKQVYRRKKSLAAELSRELFAMFQTPSFNKIMVRELPDHLAITPALLLLNHINEECLALTN